MDNGAHFHKCDFQVHTPRDLNWAGHCPVSDEERRVYAKDFVRACREKGLDAVAITDHHDTAFFSFIRAAARAELRPDGTPLPEDEKLTVFPGMELTLGIPCQALLLLDANFPEEFLPQVATALSLNPALAGDAKHAPIARLGNFLNFKDLHDRLDELSVVKGRYIILPNVNSGGQFTLQRAGFIAHYKAMQCVGGYLDHSIDGLGVGDRNILEGKVEAYDFKPLGIFPTSDNRNATFEQLAQNVAWVKWAEPTAEAVRQACLARKTRIAHTTPVLPALVIESLHVSLSKFLGDIDLEFNPQFNCMIGGRGTGKSTILEYVRWGLCDQPPKFSSDDDVPDFHSKRNALIDNTLVPYKAVVSVNFRVNGVRHIVRRRTETDEIVLKVADEPFKPVSEQDVRELLPLQAYSQKQLSAVGVRADELLRFVEAPIARRMSELRSLADDSVATIRNSYSNVQRKRKLAVEIARQEVELASLEKQLDSLRGGLKGLTPQDQQTLKDHERYTVEQQVFDQWQRNSEKLAETIRRARTDVELLPSRFTADESLPNNATLIECDARLVAVFASTRSQLEALDKNVSEDNPDWKQFADLRRAWSTRLAAHQKQYDEVKKQAVAHEALLQQIAEIENRIKTLRDTIAARKDTYASQGTPESEYAAARDEWLAQFRQRASLIDDRCKELTNLSEGAIKATLRRGAGVKQISEKLTATLEGTGVRGQSKKIDDLCSSIVEAADSVKQWEAVLAELEKLAELDFEASSNPAIPSTPLLAAAGFSKPDLEKVARKIRNENWLEISLAELEDVPSFEYMQREGDYIRFADASAGQQATALLRVLLHQSGPPLIIDQPEEDLDNQVILNIVEEIWKAKTHRQIIFSSHNANIVVNGDADLVVCCDYRTTGDQSGGRIKCQGAIDVELIRKEITTVMEGGKNAFRMRKEKYGF